MDRVLCSEGHTHHHVKQKVGSSCGIASAQMLIAGVTQGQSRTTYDDIVQASDDSKIATILWLREGPHIP